jgi:hypothetical protein
LLREVHVHGTNWSSIAAKHHPDRTTLALKNRYSALRAKSSSGKSGIKGDRGLKSPIRTRRTSRQFNVGEPKSKAGSSDEDSVSSDDETEESSQSREDYGNATDWSNQLPTTQASGSCIPGSIPSTAAEQMNHTVTLSNLFSSAMTPISSQSPPSFAGGNGYQDYKNFDGAKGQPGMLNGQLSSHMDDEMMTGTATSELCKETWNNVLKDAPYTIIPPGDSRLGAGPTISPVSMTNFPDVHEESGVVHKGAEATGLDMQTNLPSDPFASSMNLQRVSIDVVCSGDQVAPIMDQLVSRAASMTVKVQPYE